MNPNGKSQTSIRWKNSLILISKWAECWGSQAGPKPDGEGGFSLEMVMELSETDQTSTEVLVDVELLPVETLISFCLEKPSPQPHNEEGAGEQLHPALLFPHPAQLFSGDKKLMQAPQQPMNHIPPGSCVATAPRRECYNLMGMGTHRITELLRLKKSFQVIKSNRHLNTSTMFTPRPCPHVPQPRVF